jgi:phosphoribosylformylglycinamidine synthase
LNDFLKRQFDSFKNREDTFSLGVCNGCQLVSLIGWVGEQDGKDEFEVPAVALLHNRSGRFECRWSSVKIEKSESIMLRGLQGSTIGCWVAHGEGRFSFKDENVLKNLKASRSIALRYVDDDMNATEIYPMNPNGSVEGIAAICSKDGRHLAMMPHPERCCETFQWPYLPHDFKPDACPWQNMFDEAYVWCSE